jgi:hypothetical protein
MNKFDNLVNSFISEEEVPSESPVKHEFDTLSHPVKDEMVESFKNWIKEGEHQDGEAFWDNFEDVQEAVGDFLRTVGGIPG